MWDFLLTAQEVFLVTFISAVGIATAVLTAVALYAAGRAAWRTLTGTKAQEPGDKVQDE